jgi:hypothetical protein
MPASLEEFETVVTEALQKGELDRTRERVIREFMPEFEHQTRELYDSAISVSAKMYERERIAKFWQEQFAICQAQLLYLNRLDRFLRQMHSEVDISAVIERFENLLEAIRRRYEFHA